MYTVKASFIVLVSSCSLVLSQINITNLETVNNFLNSKCLENGVNTEVFLDKIFLLNSCLTQFINFTEFQNEIQEARKGLMDELAIKYCSKYPELYKCLEQTSFTLKPCLNFNIYLNETLDFMDKLKNYFCYKDGNRIAMFLAFEGLECVNLKQQNLMKCLNNVYNSNINNTKYSDFFGNSCKMLAEIRYCFHEELIKCPKHIPANVVDAFFKFLRNEFACSLDFKINSKTKNSDRTTRIVLVILYFIIAALICYKLIV